MCTTSVGPASVGATCAPEILGRGKYRSGATARSRDRGSRELSEGAPATTGGGPPRAPEILGTVKYWRGPPRLPEGGHRAPPRSWVEGNTGGGPPRLSVGLYTKLPLTISYGVWHTQGGSGGEGGVCCAIVLTSYCNRVGNACGRGNNWMIDECKKALE